MDPIGQFHNEITGKVVKIFVAELPDFIAGYSRDGTKIYIDPLVFDFKMDERPLIAHESFEMICVEVLGFSYPWSHTQATKVERGVCQVLRIPWAEHDAKYHKILEAQAKRIPKPKPPEDIWVPGSRQEKKSMLGDLEGFRGYQEAWFLRRRWT
jgi:hypothetical protein